MLKEHEQTDVPPKKKNNFCLGDALKRDEYEQW